MESTADGLHIYENDTCVLTNEPPFGYHKLRLSEFLGLSPKEPENRFSENLDLKPFSKGTATEFSDIDIYINTDNPSVVYNFIYGYGRPIYISQTLNPRGILIVIYENGVAVIDGIATDIRWNGWLPIGQVKILEEL